MKSRICLQRSKTLKTSSNWTSQETVSQKPYHERALLPSNIDKTLTTRTVSRFQLTLELEVENLILISFLELAFFAAKSRVVVILFPPTFHRLILLMLGAFHENQQHCKKFSLKSSLKLIEIRFCYFCRLIKDSRFILIVMKDVFLLGMLDFDSGERCIFVRNAKYSCSVSSRQAMLSRGHVWNQVQDYSLLLFPSVFSCTCCYTIKCVRLWNKKGQSLTFRII